jgi:hypothetical protein
MIRILEKRWARLSYIFSIEVEAGKNELNAGTASRATIPGIIYDQTGAQIASDAATLPAHGQTAFVLGDRIGAAVNSKGSARAMITPASGQRASDSGISNF